MTVISEKPKHKLGIIFFLRNRAQNDIEDGVKKEKTKKRVELHLISLIHKGRHEYVAIVLLIGNDRNS